MDEDSKDDGERYVVVTRQDHYPEGLGPESRSLAGSLDGRAVRYELTFGWQLSSPMVRELALQEAERLIKAGVVTEAHVMRSEAVFERSFGSHRTEGSAAASAGFFGRMNSSDVMRDRYYEGAGRALQPANLGRTVYDDVERNVQAGEYARERAAVNEKMEAEGIRAGEFYPASTDKEQRVADAAFNGEPDIDGEQTADELARTEGGVRPAQIDPDTPAEQFREPVGASTFGRTLQAGEEPQT